LLLCAGQERQHPLEWLGDATKNSISELWLDGRIEALRSAHSSRQCPLPSCCQNCSFC
jgi:hypothetical protein